VLLRLPPAFQEQSPSRLTSAGTRRRKLTNSFRNRSRFLRKFLFRKARARLVTTATSRLRFFDLTSIREVKRMIQ
jgi:hypothetical protein